VLVNNAAHQMSFNAPDEISDEEWERTFAVNISAMFYLVKAATPHMRPGSTIINTASINSDSPTPHLLAYGTTKGAIQNFTGGLAQLLPTKESESTPWRRAPSGRRSYPRPCRQSMWRISERTILSNGPPSRAS
jgi:NADP-dependent 3-hydroxy acid dehydrogenase YdfG